MKKILAILLVMSMMFAFVACGGNEENPTTTTNNEEATSDQAVNSNDVDLNSEDTTGEEGTSDEPVTNDKGEEITSDKDSDKKTDEEPSTERELPDDPAKWTKAEVVEFYKQAAIKTHPTASSSQTMTMPKLVVNDGDGALGFFLNIIKPVINTVLKNNTTTYNGLTGGFTKLEASDAKTAKAYKQGKYTIVEMVMVEQTDGIYGDMHGGSVGHAINVLGNVATAAEQFPSFDIKFEDADIKVHYAKPTVKVRINEKGIIEKGTWSYTAEVYIRNLKIDSIMVKKADAEIVYVITTGGGF